MLELPAGKLEEGDDPFEAMKRDLSEETGHEGSGYIDLGKAYPTPGYTNEVLHLWACKAHEKGELHLDEDEFLEVEKIHYLKANEMVLNNDIPDPKTHIAVLTAFAFINAAKL